jgi:hypothetical protein
LYGADGLDLERLPGEGVGEPFGELRLRVRASHLSADEEKTQLHLFPIGGIELLVPSRKLLRVHLGIGDDEVLFDQAMEERLHEAALAHGSSGWWVRSSE